MAVILTVAAVSGLATGWLVQRIRCQRAAAATIQRMAEARLAYYRRMDTAHAVATASER